MGWGESGVRTTSQRHGERKNGIRNCRTAEWEGDIEWTLIKKIKDNIKIDSLYLNIPECQRP